MHPRCHCQCKIPPTQGKGFGAYHCGPSDPAQPDIDNAAQNCYKILRCPWVFVNPAMVGAWQANPKQVDPRYHATSIAQAVERACRKSGVNHATFHDLRHTFVTNARHAGYVSIAASSRLPGMRPWPSANGMSRAIGRMCGRPSVSQTPPWTPSTSPLRQWMRKSVKVTGMGR
jgi:hypothetical protein